MDNRKNYVSAEIKLTELNETDVIRTSGERPGIDLPDIDIASVCTVLSGIVDSTEQ